MFIALVCLVALVVSVNSLGIKQFLAVVCLFTEQFNLPKVDAFVSRKSVHLAEVSAYGRLKICCLYVAGTMTTVHVLMIGVCLHVREVSIIGGLTVLIGNSLRVCVKLRKGRDVNNIKKL